MPTPTPYGYPLIDGDDWVDSLPSTDALKELILRGLIRVPVTSVEKRNELFPNPTAYQRPVAYIASIAEEHRWDGRQWLIFDDRPKAFESAWQTWPEVRTLAVGALGDASAAIFEGKMQRQGHWVDWTIIQRRGPDTYKGSAGEMYTWSLPFAVRDWVTATGNATVRPYGKVITAGVVWADASKVQIALGDNTRMGYDSYTWRDGDRWQLSGRNMLGGLQL